MHKRRLEKPFPYVVAWAVVTLAAFAGTGHLRVAAEGTTQQAAAKAAEQDPAPAHALAARTRRR